MSTVFKLTILLVIFNASAFATGGVDGGGGNAVVCRDDQDEITTVELLDIYEGKILYDLTFDENFNDIESAFTQIATKMKQVGLGYTLLGTYRNFKMLPKGVRLKPIPDSDHIFIPANCKVEQIANYYHASIIYVVSDFFNKMTLANQVALVVHEAIFAQERLMGVENSRYARRVTAHALSNNFEFDDPREGFPKKGILCTTPIGKQPGSNYDINPGLKKTTSFWAIPLKENEYETWRFQFLSINGHTVYSKTYIDLDPNFDNFKFPMQLIEKREPEYLTFSTTSYLTSKLDVNQTFTFEVINSIVNLDMFMVGQRPAPGPWMKEYSTNYMYLHWVGFDPGDSFTKVQIVCGEAEIPGK